MLHAFFLAAILTAAGGETPVVSPVPTAQMQPGYGVVQRVTRVRLRAPASAAAGGSVPAYPAYRLTVRMPDGSLQYRDVERPEFRPGEHVLLTNAGDVVSDEPLRKRSAAPRAPTSAEPAASRE